MKKFLSSLSALALAVTLAACSGGGSTSTPAASDAPVNDGPKEITVSTSNNGWDLSPFGADTGTRYVVWNNIYDVLCARVEFGDDVDDLEMDIAKSVKVSDDGLTAEIVDVFSADSDCKHRGIQTLALTFRTRCVVDKLIVIVGFFPVHALGDFGDHAFPLHVLALNAGVKGTCDVIGFRTRTPEQGIERRFRVVLDRRFQIEAVFSTDRIENRA